MTHTTKQFSDSERIRLRFLSGGLREKEVRGSLLSEEETRKQCDLMAELIFALCSELQQLKKEKDSIVNDYRRVIEDLEQWRSETEGMITMLKKCSDSSISPEEVNAKDQGEPLERPATDSIGE